MLLTAADGRQCRQADGDVGDKPGTPSRAAEVRSGRITWLGRGHVVTIGLQVAAQPTLVRRAVSIRFGLGRPQLTTTTTFPIAFRAASQLIASCALSNGKRSEMYGLITPLL